MAGSSSANFLGDADSALGAGLDSFGFADSVAGANSAVFVDSADSARDLLLCFAYISLEFVRLCCAYCIYFVMLCARFLDFKSQNLNISKI